MAEPGADYVPVLTFTDLITDLHKQAHPDQATDPLACRRDPCRLLTIRELTADSYIAGDKL